MKTSSSSSSQLEQIIRESFLLNPNYPVSSALIQCYEDATRSGNFSKIASFTQDEHNDEFAIHITHDIDWLSPFHPYSFLNYARSFVSNHSWLKGNQLLDGSIFLRSIEQLLQLEKELGIQGIFCVGASNRLQIGRFDIRYGINQKLFTELIQLLQSFNSVIGLHSSYQADKKKTITRESAVLAKTIKHPISIHRSHFLNFQPQSLYPQLVAANIKFDLGFGYARTVGLRNGFPGKYKPVDSLSGEVLNLNVIPLILLDNVFFTKPYHEVMQDFRQTLEQLKQYKGSACILFHPENMIIKPQLWNYFEEIIHICKEEGAKLNPPL